MLKFFEFLKDSGQSREEADGKGMTMLLGSLMKSKVNYTCLACGSSSPRAIQRIGRAYEKLVTGAFWSNLDGEWHSGSA